jgi:hypothetical protein
MYRVLNNTRQAFELPPKTSRAMSTNVGLQKRIVNTISHYLHIVPS